MKLILYDDNSSVKTQRCNFHGIIRVHDFNGFVTLFCKKGGGRYRFHTSTCDKILHWISTLRLVSVFFSCKWIQSLLQNNNNRGILEYCCYLGDCRIVIGLHAIILKIYMASVCRCFWSFSPHHDWGQVIVLSITVKSVSQC